MRWTAFPLAIGLALLVAGSAAAGPLMPSLGSTPVAGEETFVDTFGPFGPDPARVDWMVLGPGDGGGVFAPLIDNIFDPMNAGDTIVPAGMWVYAYQIEALADGTEQFTIDVDDTSDVVAIGSSAFDLDLVGHTAGATFPNLGGATPETEFGVQLPLQGTIGQSIDIADVSWNFASAAGIGFGFLTGEESEVLWFVATRPPAYRASGLLDSGGAGFPAGGQLPSPAPEPGTLFLLSTALLGLSASAYRRGRKGRKDK